jgi:hypothetical protein
MIEVIDVFKIKYGKCKCHVRDCNQRVQDVKEFKKHGKKSFCYMHAKCRDKLFGRAVEYSSEQKYRNRVPDWDLGVS